MTPQTQSPLRSLSSRARHHPGLAEYAQRSWSKLESNRIRYSVRKLAFANMQDYIRIQPEGTMESTPNGSTRTAQTGFPVYRKN
jgi:hypothetical protein